MSESDSKLLNYFYPESIIGGYSRVDGTIEFYGRVRSLLQRTSVVLDYGSGRGAWFEEFGSGFKRDIRAINEACQQVVGCDVDEAVLSNRHVTSSVVICPKSKLPFPDEAFDLVLSDYVFEHIEDPAFVTSELKRILRPGGWICARTPNKYGYISVFTRLIKNKYHKRVLGWAQPSRKEIDIFPTYFRLNRARDLKLFFPESEFRHLSYFYEGEPAYHFNNKIIYFILKFVNSIIPDSFLSSYFIFIQKR